MCPLLTSRAGRQWTLRARLHSWISSWFESN
jgi:hypothetical protein